MYVTKTTCTTNSMTNQSMSNWSYVSVKGYSCEKKTIVSFLHEAGQIKWL